MGFNTLRVDLNDPACHGTDFWRPYLKAVDFVVNTAGLLRASKAQFENVHITAPAALYQAMEPSGRGLFLFAVGIDKTQSNFAHYQREGEQVARDNGIFVLRNGMVFADTSYGGSSLARSLAAVPFCLPIVGSGQQNFDPIHADDLAMVIRDCLLHQKLDGQYEIGGAEEISQQDMLGEFRKWLGLSKVRKLRIPIRVAHMLGRVGDVLRLGPISRDTVTQLSAGVLANSERLLAKIDFRPRGFSEFHANRPAGTQDLWHARLYLMRPVLRIVLAAMCVFRPYWPDPTRLRFSAYAEQQPIFGQRIDHTSAVRRAGRHRDWSRPAARLSP